MIILLTQHMDARTVPEPAKVHLRDGTWRPGWPVLGTLGVHVNGAPVAQWLDAQQLSWVQYDALVLLDAAVEVAP